MTTVMKMNCIADSELALQTLSVVMIIGAYPLHGSVTETRIVQEGKMNLKHVNLKTERALVIFSPATTATAFLEHMCVMGITIV